MTLRAFRRPGVVDSVRGSVATGFSSIDPALAEALRRAFAAAYVAAFRTLMLVNATMAAAGALGAAVLIGRRSTR